MRWKGRRRSSNVEDRRGQGMGKGAAIGGGGIVMALVAIFLLGQDPEQVLQGMQQQPQQQQGPYQGTEQEQRVADCERGACRYRRHMDTDLPTIGLSISTT